MSGTNNDNGQQQQHIGPARTDCEERCGRIVKCVVQPKVMYFVNLLNAGGVGFVGVFIFMSMYMGDPKYPVCEAGACIQTVLCGFYSIVCGLIFLIFSLGFVGPLDRCNRKNFGFMYTFYGRFLFVCFAGSLCFALKDASTCNEKGCQQHWIGVLVGGLSWANAIVNVWAICNYPEYTNDRGGSGGNYAANGGAAGAGAGASGSQAGSATRDPEPAFGTEYGKPEGGRNSKFGSEAASPWATTDKPPTGDSHPIDNPFA
eukprot:g4790.t1